MSSSVVTQIYAASSGPLLCANLPAQTVVYNWHRDRLMEAWRRQATCWYSSQHILCTSILCHNKFQQSQVIDETRPLCVSCVFTAVARLVFTSFKFKCYKSDLLQRFWIIQQDPSKGWIESVLWWRVIICFYCNAHSRRDSAPALTASQNHLQTLAGVGCQSMGTAPAALRREEHPSHPTQQLLSATSVATTQYQRAADVQNVREKQLYTTLWK